MTTTARKITAKMLAPEGIAVRTAGAVQLRDDSTEGGAREFSGIGITYGETYETPWFREQFAPGSVADDAGVPLFYGHNHYRGDAPIGTVPATRDEKNGRHVTGKISATARGDEAYTLLRDEAVGALSIGFDPVEWREEYSDDDDRPLIVHTKVRVREYSLTPFPAYAGALVESVRHSLGHDAPPPAKTPTDPPSTTPEKETPAMDPDEQTTNAPAATRADVDTVRTGLADLRRELQAGAFGTESRDESHRLAAVTEFRDSGEWLQAIAKEAHPLHERAVALYRDVTTAEIPELATAPGFLGDYTRKIQSRRKWINRFGGPKTLPAKGMEVSYRKRAATGTVRKQVAELAPLVKGTTRTVTTAKAPVETYGGAETLSRQIVDRAEPWVIADTLEAMALDYAAETDRAFRAHILAGWQDVLTRHRDTTADQSALAVDVPSTFGAFDWIRAIVTAAEILDERNRELQMLAVSSDIFIRLAEEAGTDGRPLMTTHGTGSNVVGEVNLPGLSGNLMRVPVEVILGAPEATAQFLDPVAFDFHESPGAPFNLQDDNVLNLSRDYALYGYAAMLTPYEDAILPVNFTAAGA